MTKSCFSLSQFNSMIREKMNKAFPGEYWVVGETSDVRYNNNGHCYLELVERNTTSVSIIAKARAYIWSNIFMLLRPYFEEKAGQAFTSGIKVLVKVSVDFHPLYGMGLTILDIDPTYTLGDMQQRRQQVLDKLTEEGVIDMNKELDFPLIPQRIAVITSPTAAGYGDFLHHLTSNSYGFVFYPHLFPAVMQGDNTETSIIEALEKIFCHQEQFDVVVIIRGGGATSDLVAFDSYLLALHCAQFPLPVITGIGHERDNTVLDYVSYYRAKTPTAVADFLIEKTNIYYNKIISAQQFIAESAKALLVYAKEEQNMLGRSFQIRAQMFLKGREEELARMQSFIKLSSPEYILSKGYAIVYKNGEAAKSVNGLEEGDIIETHMTGGIVESRILSKRQQPKKEAEF